LAHACLYRGLRLAVGALCWAAFSVDSSAQTGVPVQLTSDQNGLIKRWPAWSPDGDWIAFSRYEPALGWSINKVAATGGPGLPLTGHGLDEKANTVWALDTSFVYYTQGLEAGSGPVTRVLSIGGPEQVPCSCMIQSLGRPI